MSMLGRRMRRRAARWPGRCGGARGGRLPRLRHGRVYPKSTTWTAEHRRWLSQQRFDQPTSDLVFADLLAAVDGLSSRKAQVALRLSQLATDEQWWPTVARLRAFRGIDTLTA